MKRIILAVLALALMLPFGAQAADDKMPTATPSTHIALLYEKLTNKTGKMPAFETWVKDWTKYKNANFAVRQSLMETKTTELRNIYSLITYSEPIVVKAKVKISAYSPMGKGFLVQNFNNMTFFRYYHMGKAYALIPNGMAKYQWLRAPASMSDIMMRETQNGHEAVVTITMTSMKADPQPMPLGRQKYKLLMAEISKIELWSRDGKNIIWDDQIGSTDRTHKNLLNLRQ